MATLIHLILTCVSCGAKIEFDSDLPEWVYYEPGPGDVENPRCYLCTFGDA